MYRRCLLSIALGCASTLLIAWCAVGWTDWSTIIPRRFASPDVSVWHVIGADIFRKEFGPDKMPRLDPTPSRILSATSFCWAHDPHASIRFYCVSGLPFRCFWWRTPFTRFEVNASGPRRGAPIDLRIGTGGQRLSLGRWTIPHGILYINAILNVVVWTVLWAVILCGLSSVELHLRQFNRRRRGNCVICVYPLDAWMDHCPECGHLRK
jgi:hypothetical protein